jgi:hypothetical protein
VKTEHARRIYFEQLRRVVSLSMVLARYNIELRRQGQQLVGPCPIHGGSDRRQFVVKPTTSEWHCFGDCKRGGAMLEFVAAKENVDIVEAARLIARWFAIGTGDQPHSQQQRRSKVMSDNQKPSHKAFVVEDRAEGSDRDAFWTRIGSAWPHKDGKGLNVQLASGVAVSGRLVLREYTEEDAQEEQKSKRRK